ncbi:hypothetical protein Kisp01_17420 [Kineosporia sp. NBRC 101677]|uniref:DinB family protein n=1 Tax=Kineosporia sp. NBRC 101677 TaxID=3032197 RepID=UPI0024A1B375|nr:DinB family protein [Kineosporia sp. NBRC 101677]GLY14727.1 hypothetical protein Kisp01_17420 [Kineosporia sp. NBRC 101677]
MTDEDLKADLHNYLKEGRTALLWKLEGLSEYDLRRPLVPTGTNLLGLVKHTSNTEAGYFGSVFGRPCPAEQFPWGAEDESDDPNIDMYAAEDETPQQVLERYRQVCEHADATIEALPLDAPGTVPWWRGERSQVTLHRILTHMIAELHRHAGHADIVRELIDGEAGHRPESSNLPDNDWSAYREQLEALALRFREQPA